MERSNKFERGLSRAEGILRSCDVIACALVASRLRATPRLSSFFIDLTACLQYTQLLFFLQEEDQHLLN